jgi:hypothetical protein
MKLTLAELYNQREGMSVSRNITQAMVDSLSEDEPTKIKSKSMALYRFQGIGSGMGSRDEDEFDSLQLLKFLFKNYVSVWFKVLVPLVAASQTYLTIVNETLLTTWTNDSYELQ